MFAGPVAAGQHEGGGQEGQGREQGTDDADGADGAEPAGGAQVAEQQAQQAHDDGPGGGGDGFEGAPPGQPHGLVPVVVAAQFLPVAGDEQQGVVGGRTDDEDRQDALGLPVEGDHLAIGEQVDDEAGQAEREAGGQEHEQRDQRAAVDDDEDEGDGGQGDEQEEAVDAAEGLDQVGDGARGPGHVHLGPAGGQPVVGLAESTHGALHDIAAVGQGRADPGIVEVHQDEGGPPVRGGRDGHRSGCQVVAEPGGAVTDGEGQGGDAGGEVTHGRELGGGQRSGRLDEQERREDLAALETVLQGGDPAGLGAAREEQGGVALLDLGQLAVVGTADPADREPGEQQHGGDGPAQAAQRAGSVAGAGTGDVTRV